MPPNPVSSPARGAAPFARTWRTPRVLGLGTLYLVATIVLTLGMRLPSAFAADYPHPMPFWHWLLFLFVFTSFLLDKSIKVSDTIGVNSSTAPLVTLFLLAGVAATILLIALGQLIRILRYSVKSGGVRFSGHRVTRIRFIDYANNVSMKGVAVIAAGLAACPSHSVPWPHAFSPWFHVMQLLPSLALLLLVFATLDIFCSCLWQNITDARIIFQRIGTYLGDVGLWMASLTFFGLAGAALYPIGVWWAFSLFAVLLLLHQLAAMRFQVLRSIGQSTTALRQSIAVRAGDSHSPAAPRAIALYSNVAGGELGRDQQLLAYTDALLAGIAAATRAPLAHAQRLAAQLQTTSGTSTTSLRRLSWELDDQLSQIVALLDQVASQAHQASAMAEAAHGSIDLGLLLEHIQHQNEWFLQKWFLDFDWQHTIHIRGNWDAIGQVVQHLIGNARARSSGRQRILICLRTRGSDAVLTVRDDGPPIAPGQLDSLFMGQQAHTPTTGMADAALTDLRIADRIVAAQGGRIWIEPQEASGTTIAVSFPLWQQAAQHAEMPSPAPSFG